jgi:hypothetical protein
MLLSTVSPNKDLISADLGWTALQGPRSRTEGQVHQPAVPLPVRVRPSFTAIILLGGDKTGDWTGWYREAIPEAERLYTEHLDELTKEGKL